MKLYFSGAQYEKQRSSFRKVGAENLLYNFFYMDSSSEIDSEEESIIIDSGATLFERDQRDDSEWDKYLDNYIEFLSRNIDRIDFAIEIFHRENDMWWQDAREKLCDIFPGKILPVLYPGIDDYGMLSKYDYMALGKVKTLTEYNRIIGSSDFIERGVKFHALGITDPEMLIKGKFYSADTYAPLVGGKWGALYIYKGKNTLKRVYDTNTVSYKRKAVRAGLRNEIESLGLDWDLFDAEESTELNSWNTSQWLKLSQDLDEKEGYFQSSEEREGLVISAREKLGIVPQPTGACQGGQFRTDPILDIRRQCNTCSIKDVCPKYIKDSFCTLEQFVSINNTNDVVDAFHHLLALQMSRVSAAIVQEKLRGDVISPEVTLQIEQTARMFEGYRKTAQSVSELNISASGKGVGILGELLQGIARAGVGHGGNGPQYSVMEKEQSKREAIRASVRETEEMESEIIDVDVEESEEGKK